MITVIIPAYNCRGTIEKALSSLVAQTDSNFITIIVDDCSTERIDDIVDAFRGVLNLKYIRNQHNVGCGMSRQVGIDACSSTHYCFLDSDDMFMPYTVQVFNEILADSPDIEMLCGDFYRQDYIKGRLFISLEQNGFTWCHGKLYNKKKVEQFGIRNRPDVKYADDSFFNSMCFELLKVQKVELPLYLYTANPNSVTRCENGERDKTSTVDFLHAMLESTKHILKYKNKVEHLDNTLKLWADASDLTGEALQIYEELKSLSKKSDQTTWMTAALSLQRR